MKRLLFILFAALYLCACAKQDSASEESPVTSHLSFWWQKHDSINHAYVETAEPIWLFGRHGEDIYDWTYQEKWYYECRKVLINAYDSIHPGEKGDDKDLRMVDELIQFFETEQDYSTMERIIFYDLQENFMTYKVVAMSMSTAIACSKRQDKLNVMREINAWNKFHRLFCRFSLYMVYFGWYGGSGSGPACAYMSYIITHERFKDVERLNKFVRNEWPINNLVCANAPACQFEDAVDSVIRIRKLPPEASDSEYEGYEEEYYNTIAYRDSLIDAYHHWASARENLLMIKNRKSQNDKMTAAVTYLVLLSGEQ